MSYVQEQSRRWQGLFQDLIRLPSTFEKEHEVIEFLADHLQSLGVTACRVFHDSRRLRGLPAAVPPFSDKPNRCSIVTRVPGRGEWRSLLLAAHMDVVPAGAAEAWRHPPFAGYIDTSHGIIYGRGAMDDKAGVVIALAVLETVVKVPVRLTGDLVCHFVLEDEITGNGTLLCLADGHRADAAVILDGTRPDRAINQHAGNLRIEIEVKGRPAAVGVSHLGVNAAEMLARLFLRLKEFVHALNVECVPPWTQFPSPFQFVVCELASQGDALTIPESARAACHVTFPPPWTAEKMRNALRAQVQAFAREHSLPEVPRVQVTGLSVDPIASSSVELEAALQRTASALGWPPIQIAPSTGTSDLRHFAAAGIPCLLYGPGRGYNPHRPDEHYLLEDLPRMILFMLTLAQDWCGHGGDHFKSKVMPGIA
jgi:acetylornithine deacetylase